MPKRTLQGVVVSDKQAKTVVVRVDRRFTHPIYKKTIRTSKNYHAHDENNEFKPGDQAWIEESKPISKLKRCVVVGGEQKNRAGRRVGLTERDPGYFRRKSAHQKEDEVHQ